MMAVSLLQATAALSPELTALSMYLRALHVTQRTSCYNTHDVGCGAWPIHLWGDLITWAKMDAWADELGDSFDSDSGE